MEQPSSRGFAESATLSKVEWDQGKNTFAVLETGIVLNTFRKTGLRPGTTYVFRVFARNKVCYSETSPELSAKTSDFKSSNLMLAVAGGLVFYVGIIN